METKAALAKANKRKLITEEQFVVINNKQIVLHKLLNAYIKSIGQTNSTSSLNDQ